MFVLPVYLPGFRFFSTTGKKKFGIYSGLGYRNYLNPCGVFQYSYSGHLSGDTSAGQFTISGDTVKFVYSYNNFDSIIADAQARGVQPQVDIFLRNTTAKAVRMKEGILGRYKLYLFWKDIIHEDRQAYLKRSKG